MKSSTTRHLASVISAGPHFALAAVTGNFALRSVLVPKEILANLAVGEQVLIGGIEYRPAGPRALAASRAGQSEPRPRLGLLKPKAPSREPSLLFPEHRTAVHALREVGVIASVAGSGTFGRIIADRTGDSVFLPGSALMPGASLKPGLRVSFLREVAPKGPVAKAVQLAA
jgi:cold shock CspA family protein